jgi:carbon-monoxide dehydrogenase catalytic subunit
MRGKLPVVTARNFARMVAAGTAAHSDHARDLSNTLLAVARGEAKDFQIKDVRKLNRVAGYLGINIEGKPVNKVAEEVALKFIEQFGQQKGELVYLPALPNGGRRSGKARHRAAASTAKWWK